MGNEKKKKKKFLLLQIQYKSKTFLKRPWYFGGKMQFAYIPGNITGGKSEELWPGYCRYD